MAVLDEYLEFVAGRSRPNTLLATAFDLAVFFRAVGKPPAEVTSRDVMAFIAAQRFGGQLHGLHPVTEGAGLSARTVARRLSSISGLFAFLVVRGDLTTNPVPRGLMTRRETTRPRQTVPLIRTPRTLPRVLTGAQVEAVVAALRHHRDTAMVLAMVLGGLRRCEVLGLRIGDIQAAQRRVFIAEGKGGHQRLVSISDRFFTALGAYLDAERPTEVDTDAVFVVLKGHRRGQPLSASGLDQILEDAKGRAGLDRLTCHQLRHTCLTRLREAGMALEAVQAQAGHRSIETTRIYLHLADDWFATQYRQAAEAIDAQILIDHPHLRGGQR